MPASPSAPESLPPRRFQIALSYPSEHRAFVKRVAKRLSAAVGPDRVLYDKFHEAEFARIELDVYLPRMYSEQSELIVVFLCPKYATKLWCQLEWGHISDLIATVEAGRIMPLRFGSLSPDELAGLGLLDGDSLLAVGRRSAASVAELILERLKKTLPLAEPKALPWTADPAHRELAALVESVQGKCDEYLDDRISGKPYELELTWRDATDEPVDRPLEGGLLSLFRRRDRLLILGKPGSGKSVELRRLARDLAATVLEAPGPPPKVPVYLALSSWRPSDRDLSTWLIWRLNKEYSFAPKDASKWVEPEMLLLPLLDGLDEVSPDSRPRCVAAINSFLDKYGGGVVVSSRPEAHSGLPEQLDVRANVALSPLSEARVETCLATAGPGLDALRTALRENLELSELARTPLMLGLMIDAFQDAASKDLDPVMENATAERVVAAYVKNRKSKLERKIEETPGSVRYDPNRTLRSLAWFAHRLSAHPMPRFEIERLQATWLALPWRWAYAILSRSLAGALVAAIFVPVGHYWFLPLFGLASGALVGVIDALPLWRAPPSGRVRDNIPQSVVRVMILGAAVFFVYLLLWRAGKWTTDVPIAFIVTMATVNGLVFGLRPGDLAADTRFFETMGRRLGWSWKGGLLGAGIPLVMALAVLALLRSQDTFPRDLGPAFLLIASLFLLLSGFLAGGIIGGLEGSIPKVRKKPNQGVRRTVRTSFRAFLAAVPLMILPMAIGLALDLRNWVAGAWFGVAIGLLTALWFGGIDILQHFLLRSLLSASGRFPWRWIGFLEHGVGCGLLYTVDGGYEFPHRMVRDYFVSLWERRSAAPGEIDRSHST